MVSLGRPLGSVVRPLLLQRTTVSRQEHSAGHLSTGEQLFSSLPDRHGEMDGVVEMGGRMMEKWRQKKIKAKFVRAADVAKRHSVKCKSAPSHHLHRQSPGLPHPGWGSPSGNKDSGSEGYR